MALSRQVSPSTDSGTPTTQSQTPTSGAGWLQGVFGNSALLGGLGALGARAGAGLGTSDAGGDQAQTEVPAIGSNAELTAQTVRSGLTNNPRATTALDALTGDVGFQALSADRQGALLEQFQTAPNAATAQYLRGLAAYHTAEDEEAGRAAFEDALNPDSGTVTLGGQTYTIRDGQLLDADGQAAGDIHTDGSYQLNGEEERSSIYDDIHARVQMIEGTGRDQQTLLDLRDADPRNKLDAAGMNDTFTGLVKDTIRDLRRENIDMRVTDGFRSFQEQDDLYAQGRTRPGRRVTGARGGQSWHNYGLGADLAMQDANGVHWRTNGEHARLWQRYGELAEGNGLTWGGDWQNVDMPHVEYHPGFAESGAGQLSDTLRRRGLEAAWDRMGIGEQP